MLGREMKQRREVFGMNFAKMDVEWSLLGPSSHSPRIDQSLPHKARYQSRSCDLRHDHIQTSHHLQHSQLEAKYPGNVACKPLFELFLFSSKQGAHRCQWQMQHLGRTGLFAHIFCASYIFRERASLEVGVNWVSETQYSSFQPNR
jgi:hypothetical protein